MTKSETKARIKEINGQLDALLQDDRRIKSAGRDDRLLKNNNTKRELLLEDLDMLKSELKKPTLISSYIQDLGEILAQILDLEWELRQKQRQLNIQLRKLKQRIKFM